MIRIDRTYPAPESLASDRTVDAKEAIAKIAKSRKPMSDDFDSNIWGRKDVRSRLWQMHHGKCCYCERKRDTTHESDVEHFRPKARVTDSDHEGYWWLAYEWENLLFACPGCNRRFKLNCFPIPDEKKRARTSRQNLDKENAYLLDPTKDNPEEHLAFDWFEKCGKASEKEWVAFIHERGGSVRGRRTIDIAGLNREELPLDRGALVLELEALATSMIANNEAASLGNTSAATKVAKLAKKIEFATSGKRPFTAFRRDFFRKRGLGDFVAKD